MYCLLLLSFIVIIIINTFLNSFNPKLNDKLKYLFNKFNVKIEWVRPIIIELHSKGGPPQPGIRERIPVMIIVVIIILIIMITVIIIIIMIVMIVIIMIVIVITVICSNKIV